MTESEAIKEFQQNIDMPFGSNISREASELAIQALEKQIPKKPIRHAVWEDFKCPACGSTEIRPYDTEYREYDKDCEFEYCSDCGQKLDWSDEE